MKFIVFAAAGLVCMTAAVAHAQGQAAPAATPAPAAAAPDRSCMLVTQTDGRYLDIPLTGFDPARPGPLPAVTASNPIMVVCNRTTIVPEITDYRVLTELRLPLSIKAGQKSLFLGVSGGKLQVGMPQGEATPEDTKAVQERLDQMEVAMQAKPRAK